MKIVGNTVGTSLPKSNLMQDDPKKGDFVKGKDEFLERFGNGNSPDSGQNADCIIPVDFSGATVHSVNHRGYSSAAPENTIPAYIMSKEKGFTCVEADVAFTADGVAVLLHDSTIDRTSNGSGSISSLTYAEVSKYDFGSWKSDTYAGTRIPTFAEFIAFCKNVGLHPYIELKNAATYTAAQIQSLVTMVNKCGMRGKVSWISFNAAYLGYVRDADPTARLGYLVSSITATAISMAQSLQTGRNEVFLDSSDYDADAIARCQTAGLPLEIWTINSQSIIESMDPYITGVTSDSLIAEEILREKAMTYDYGITAVTVTAISATYTGGDVAVGTSLNNLTGLTVTATYSDGSTAPVTGYTLSGEISEGENTITVTYGGKTTTFAVTGVTDSGGEDAPDGPELLYSWDFRKSLTDDVSGRVATVGSFDNTSTPVQDDNGVTLEAANQYVYLGHIELPGKSIEIDVDHFEFAGNEGYHIRFLMAAQVFGNGSTGFGPLIWRSSNNIGWSGYGLSSASANPTASASRKWADNIYGNLSGVDAINYFSGKTIKVAVASDGVPTLFVDGVEIGSLSGVYFSDTLKAITIGGIHGLSDNASNGNQCYNMTISGIRVFANQ